MQYLARDYKAHLLRDVVPSSMMRTWLPRPIKLNLDANGNLERADWSGGRHLQNSNFRGKF